MQANIHDKRAVKLEKVLAGDFIPLFAGRPARAAEISKDDMLDLKIALHTSHSFEDFLAKV